MCIVKTRFGGSGWHPMAVAKVAKINQNSRARSGPTGCSERVLVLTFQHKIVLCLLLFRLCKILSRNGLVRFIVLDVTAYSARSPIAPKPYTLA